MSSLVPRPTALVTIPNSALDPISVSAAKRLPVICLGTLPNTFLGNDSIPLLVPDQMIVSITIKWPSRLRSIQYLSRYPIERSLGNHNIALYVTAEWQFQQRSNTCLGPQANGRLATTERKRVSTSIEWLSWQWSNTCIATIEWPPIPFVGRGLGFIKGKESSQCPHTPPPKIGRIMQLKSTSKRSYARLTSYRGGGVGLWLTRGD